MFVLKSFPMNSSPRFAAGLSAGNIIVPLFIPTYCTIGHSFLSHPSLLGSHGASSRVLPVTSQFLSSAFSTPPWLTQAPCHQPRIFTHPWKAGYKNKGWAICRSSRLATHKCWGPQLQATNVPGWETACVFQEQGRRDNRYCNLGGSLLILFIYGSFVALTHLDNNNRSILN